jgi:cytoskeletal protein CcmA (bactofilin family)
MQNGARLGSTVFIKGDITAQEPLTIAGRVDGTINVTGHIVTVERGAHIDADISAAGIVIAGEVKGSLAADSRIHLQPGADVEGDLSAPRIAVDEGAFVQGKIQVAGHDRVTMVA